MATNSSRGNDIATTDGPKFDQTPPPLAADVKSDIKSATAKTLAEGEHHPGQDTLTTRSTSTPAETEQKREMEGLGRSEAAKRG
ncbi:hypothetical protein QBC39DRAFT_347754 [Podospora conica]|nr:hypothetical protein QBC39DRAFT_347754 [Schizothecium conicum]